MASTQIKVTNPPTPTGIAQTSIGRKFLMAVTGLILIGFITGHMIGNLQIFLGQAQLNKYAHALQSLGAGLWAIRGFMLAVLVVHMWLSIRLWLENRAARPTGYAKSNNVQASYGSRTMIYTGALVFFYVIYHLAHFTAVTTDPSLVQYKADLDVYSMVIAGYQILWVSLVYIGAMILLAFHLSHAISSFLQTLGLNKPTMQPKIKAVATLWAVIVAVGYISIPTAVLTNFLTLSGGGH